MAAPEDILIEGFARAIATGESLGADPDATFPWDGHQSAQPRWQWHIETARRVLAGIALGGPPAYPVRRGPGRPGLRTKSPS